ncbi:hypothetical protein S2M10_32720 [Sphingomonas sp. S2M10]|uniref:hypothetical protein n=1 Tax=Sphingomonas sp. S2M10 TaxID=2705010 RepID=UPI0014564912|nr:hypothetical protein [Sphingomonas sp. S2M10]NLS28262.1 hypothetical protein [Sphingomonas sp. S2M10]
MLTFFAAALALFSTPVIAQQAAPSTGGTTSSQTTADEKPICRRTQVTGSNFFKRECHTRVEWQSIHERDDANVNRALRNRASRNTPGD